MNLFEITENLRASTRKVAEFKMRSTLRRSRNRAAKLWLDWDVLA